MTYPLVWVGAAVVAYVAGVTSDVETGTRGLGDAIFGFIVGTVLFSMLWATVAFVRLARLGRRFRSSLAAFGTPIVVITCAFSSVPLAVAAALVLPPTASWWATAPGKNGQAAIAAADGLDR